MRLIVEVEINEEQVQLPDLTDWLQEVMDKLREYGRPVARIEGLPTTLRVDW